MRSTRIKRLKMNRKSHNQRNKAIVIIAVLFFSIILNSFQSFILKSNAASDNTDGYKNISVNWSRTKEVTTNNDGYITGGYVDAANSSNKYWETNYTAINGEKYECLNKTNGKSGVLRTDRLLVGSNRVLLDYDTLLGASGIINPTETSKVWDGKLGSGNRYFEGYSNFANATAPDYTDYATWTHQGAGDNQRDQWRAFRGGFTDSDLGLKDIDGNYIANKRVYVGVNSLNPELIMPVNDYVIILVDGQVTKMNFSTQPVSQNNGNKDNLSLLTKDVNGNKSVQKIDFQTLYFCQNWPGNDQNFKCNDINHRNNSLHTDTWHAHLDNKVTQNDGQNLRLGDITEYLNPNVTNHKIEIICGDYCGGGGMSKLQVYTTEEPQTKVEKQGYIIKDGKEIELNDNDPNVEIYSGDEIYYKFKIQNENPMNLPNANVSFEDDVLGIKINNQGIFIKNQSNGNYDKVSSTNLIVKKGIDPPISGENALLALTSLKGNESIEVKCTEYLKHTITDSDVANGIFKNTVVGTVSYFNGELTLSHEDTFIVLPKYPSTSETEILKQVDKVIRGNEVIFPKTGVTDVPDLKPGDKVTFSIKLINLNIRSTGLLILEDTIKGESYSNNQWTFMEGTNIFNPINFILKGKETKVITTEWIVQTPAQGKIGDYNPINTAYLKFGDKVQTSEVKLNLERPKLKIIKTLGNDSLPETDKEKTFTICVRGDDNSIFNFEAVIGEEYIIDNLEYGVKYTITEVIPMNYQGIESKEILMSQETNNSIIYIENKKINDEHFYGDDTKTNTFIFEKEYEVR